ncbi:putative quinol monooxygenase [Sphingorhabdus sp. Alg239-R122]|uniref:putative quinol monooxygenase n=1 Tax=Sphingorhabdus sp. Alg239-R122 TaxID=2305989 RepID=UPI0013DBC235|nr:putative quinol monooxygenase [Sphingorhabdus sp. Alg239-R122]
MIIVIGSVTSSRETHARISQLSLEHVVRSRAEPGCIAHNVHVDLEDESRFVFVEYWADMSALMAHFAVPASREFADALIRLSSAPPELKIYSSDEVNPGNS